MKSAVMKPLALLFTVFAVPLAGTARANDRLGGHFGAVFPLVTRTDGTTTTIGDQFKIGFPTGITVKTNDQWAFDLEFVPGFAIAKPSVRHS